MFLQGGAHIGMVGSERLLLDGERPLVERLGAGQVPDRRVAAGEGVEALGQRRVLRPQRPLQAEIRRILGGRLGVGAEAFSSGHPDGVPVNGHDRPLGDEGRGAELDPIPDLKVSHEYAPPGETTSRDSRATAEPPPGL